jgi:YYY domain-containing protein
MAGESINYYYVGYAIYGAIAKIAGVVSPVAFNLALATTTAIALAAAIGCALVFAPRYARTVAPLAGFFAVIAGNMEGPYRLLTQGSDAWNADWWRGMGWQSSRVVYDGTIQTINEFPAFSIILGDLHPHLMALPFAIVALAISAGFVRNTEPIGWVPIAFAGVLGGALYALNSWDLPTYFGLMILALIWNLRSHPAQHIALRVGGIVGVASIAWSPFILTFSPFVAGDPTSLPNWLQGNSLIEKALTTVSVNTFEFTSAGEFLRIFGLFYALIFIALIVAARKIDVDRSNLSWTVVAPIVLLVFFSLLANAPAFIFIAVPCVLAIGILRRVGPATIEGAIAALYLAGALILTLTELFFIQDQFHNRMNTLFKAYYQIWTLWGMAAAVGLGWMLARTPRPAFKAVMSVALASSLVLGLIYPVVSATRWTNEFDKWHGIDGSMYVANFSADELAGIEFIRANATDDSVVLEAPGCSYQPISRIPFSRVSALTGVPTVIGWTGHESQWRSGDDALRAEIGARRDEVHAFYQNPTIAFIDRYGIDFVYYGIYEQGEGQSSCDWAVVLPMPDAAVMAELGFEIAFQQGDVTIWQRSG